MEINSSLRNAFRFNALFSIGCATFLLFLADWWSIQFGLDGPVLVQLGSVGLIAFAAYLLWMSSTSKQSKSSIWSIIISDWGYVIAASIAIVFGMSFMSIEGIGFLTVTAVVVTIAAEWQRRVAFG